ncbi:MAG: hypothetical protein HKN82_13930 [Akkermansiaceae bacterium]|nr:hypothetical protein [Akkermansiaceae bacterium]
MRIILPLVLAALVLPSPARAGEFKVASLTFTAPAAWKKAETASPMRKAQFSVGEGDAAGEVVFYHFGPGAAGGVDANLRRWYGQFKEPEDQVNAKTVKAKAGEIPVTYASAQGTFLSGPPRGPKVEKPGYALLAAIVEAKDGAVFIKFTGPAATVSSATADFKNMVEGAK